MMFVDPVQPVLDYRVVGLAFVSVGLFIASTITTYLVNDKLASLKTGQQAVLDKLDKIAAVQDRAADTVDKHLKEAHEQWSKLNENNSLLKENSFIIRDLKDSVDATQEQQTILATAQVKANETQQKITDAFVRVLTEHARESRE